jgi:endonuclease/exonuclease/phosphatase family metal-dependent hydrolase
MTSNLLNYPGSNSAVRNPEFRKIIRYVNPDILAVQEMVSAAGVSEFLTNVLNAGQPGTYSGAPFENGPDTDNMLFYKSALFAFVDTTVLHTALRDIVGYQIRPAGVNADSVDFYLFSCHLHASQGYETERFAEADTLRNYLNSLPDGLFLMTAGDMNLYTSNEAAYQELIGSQGDNSGRMYDPINTPGNWHSNANFAAVHTQSTRTENLGDGGATGGLDDRFDFLLLSSAFQSGFRWHYVNGSYTEVGNDGNHFNLSINDGTNTAVPDSIADALHMVSDHLPVYLDLYRQTQPPASITLIAPNGGETWYTGTVQNVAWTSQNLPGTISIKLNRNYPAGPWENVILGTENDGQFMWTVTQPASALARVQVSSDSQSGLSDISDANFTVTSPILSLTSPDGGESWVVGANHQIAWNSAGLSGSVQVALNRTYPTGGWQVLFSSVPIQNGVAVWAVSGPATQLARVRVRLISDTTIADVSSDNFAIRFPPQPPVLVHDPHSDSIDPSVTFTAKVTDEMPGATAKLFYIRAGSMDSVAMLSTGNGAEVAVDLSLGLGTWDYFIRVTDSDWLTTTTDTFSFVVGSSCGMTMAYDDGTPELFNWSAQDSFAWAVRFTPPEIPFALCSADISVAGFHPDSTHSQIIVRVMAADGPGALPGSELRRVVRGSVGNAIGGLPAGVDFVTHVFLYDEISPPLELNDDFYLAVQNVANGREAFGQDTSSSVSNRSFVWDPCDLQWHQEASSDSVLRRGNRIIHVAGWRNAATDVVIHRTGDDAVLNWASTGAPYYHILKSASGEGPFTEVIGTTSDTVYASPGAIQQDLRAFYLVISASAP